MSISIAALRSRAAQASVAFVSLAVATAASAQGGGDFSETGGTVQKFLDNIQGILGLASIAVVTIAIIFAGYQIAFNNKRISDVAPILIGGLLIGAAGQIATMLIGGGAAG